MDSGPRCPACVQLLRYLCRYGEDPRLCAAYADYLVSGDARALEVAHEAAPVDLIARARAHVVALGLAQYAG